MSAPGATCLPRTGIALVKTGRISLIGPVFAGGLRSLMGFFKLTAYGSAERHHASGSSEVPHLILGAIEFFCLRGAEVPSSLPDQLVREEKKFCRRARHWQSYQQARRESSLFNWGLRYGGACQIGSSILQKVRPELFTGELFGRWP